MTSMKPRTIAAAQFKAQCLRLMDEVAATRQPLIITKHRKPVARLLPLEAPAKPAPFLDRLKGKFEIVGDLLAPPSPKEDWEYD